MTPACLMKTVKSQTHCTISALHLSPSVGSRAIIRRWNSTPQSRRERLSQSPPHISLNHYVTLTSELLNLTRLSVGDEFYRNYSSRSWDIVTTGCDGRTDFQWGSKKQHVFADNVWWRRDNNQRWITRTSRHSTECRNPRPGKPSVQRTRGRYAWKTQRGLGTQQR